MESIQHLDLRRTPEPPDVVRTEDGEVSLPEAGVSLPLMIRGTDILKAI
jgi:hypothetical protein